MGAWWGRRVRSGHLWVVCLVACLWAVGLAATNLPKLGLAGDEGRARVHSCRVQRGGPGVADHICVARWLPDRALGEEGGWVKVWLSEEAGPGDEIEVRRGMWGTLYSVATGTRVTALLAATIVFPAVVALVSAAGALVLRLRRPAR